MCQWCVGGFAKCVDGVYAVLLNMSMEVSSVAKCVNDVWAVLLNV